MQSSTIRYAGVGGAVAGVLGFLGVIIGWWEVGGDAYRGTAHASGSLALVMALATFVFGGAYVLMSDAQIRRAMGMLMALAAVVLALSAAWGFSATDGVAAGASADIGLTLSLVGGILGIIAGVLAVRESQAAEQTMGDPAATD